MNNKNALFLGGKQFLLSIKEKQRKESKKRQKQKKSKQKENKEGLGPSEWPFGPPHLTLKPSEKTKPKKQKQTK